jgi:hypothetical protein
MELEGSLQALVELYQRKDFAQLTRLGLGAKEVMDSAAMS